MKYKLQIFFLIILASCTYKRQVKVYLDKPAKVNLSKYQNVVIGEFKKSDGERDFELESTIKSMFLNNTDKTILDLDFVYNNKTINDSIINTLLVLKANIIHKDVYSRGDFFTDSDENKKSNVKQSNYLFEAVYEVNFSLSEYKSGKIIYDTTFKEFEQDNIYHTGKKELNINESKYFSVMKNKLANQLFKEILPSKQLVNINFKTLNYKIDIGINYAENGDLKKARAHFEEIINDSSGSFELSYLYYNLGLCNLYLYNFEDAEMCFKQANIFNYEIHNDYMIGITRKMKYDYENNYNK